MIVAWIWSLIWYLGLDPIKWMMMYALNEDGWRDAKAHKAAKQVCTASIQSRHHTTALHNALPWALSCVYHVHGCCFADMALRMNEVALSFDSLCDNM